MVVPNQDGVSDCREFDARFNATGTLSSRSPGRAPEIVTEIVVVEGGVRDFGIPITAPLPPDEIAKILAVTLEDLKATYVNYHKRAQANLRAYVTDKSYPLDERFDIWKKWCEKKVHGCVINATDVPLFGEVVEDNMFDFDRYADYGWEYFLIHFEDSYYKLQEKYDVTMDDVKEALIETNFGSFTMDW